MHDTNLTIQPSQILLKKIRIARLNSKLSHKDMAIYLGYKYASSYANIENGKRKLSFINAVKIMKILQLGFHNIYIENFTLNHLKQIRKNKDITLQKMAELLGYRYASGYNKIENGICTLTYDNAVKISNILESDIAALFFLTNNSQNV